MQRIGISRLLIVSLLSLVAGQWLSAQASSVYVSDFRFDVKSVKRIEIADPAKPNAPKAAYWYVTYSVTNPSKDKRLWLPAFVMMDSAQNLFRSDKDIPAWVYDAIRKQDRSPSLMSHAQVAGDLLPGDDQGRLAVAVWSEPDVSSGSFRVFVSGLSSQRVTTRSSAGAPVALEPSIVLDIAAWSGRMPAAFSGTALVVDRSWVLR